MKGGVGKVMEVFSDCVDPFETSDELASLSSDGVANESTKQDLLNTIEKGTEALSTFAEDRLLSNSKGFNEKLPKLKLGTFSGIRRKKPLHTKEGKTVVLRADRNLFARMLVIGQNHKLDLHKQLEHELGPLLWSFVYSVCALCTQKRQTQGCSSMHSM